MSTGLKRDAGPIFELLEADHQRLDGLLARAVADPSRIDREACDAFRHGLLRHIAMEEKVLLPEAMRRSGKSLPVARILRLDHAALAALLVPTPTPEGISTIGRILSEHNPLEEGPEGLYATCERLVGAQADALVERMRALPPVKVAAHFDGPRIHQHIEQLLRARDQGRR
ncbi:MAG: hemerythrin domain-containing protein [Myxococcaceae bacterium]|nr:hemerythrin domain-containing protein [Myxococcaceae bacterium]